MKLKIFNTSNVSTSARNDSSPTIAFDCKSGSFRINSAAVKLIGLKDKDRVEFACDEDDGKQWFIMVNEQTGFELREKKSVSGGLVFNSTKMAKEILESVKEKGTRAKLSLRKGSIEFKKMKLWPLDFISNPN